METCLDTVLLSLAMVSKNMVNNFTLVVTGQKLWDIVLAIPTLYP